MEIALDLILMVVTVVAVGGAARRWNLPGPLLLVLVGIAGSFLPRFDHVSLHPDIVLVGILPPLLYAAAVRTSLLDVRSNLRTILALSVGLVAVTTVGMGYLVWWVLPVPLAAGFALGAVVAPPDAVAASAIARKVGLPRRLVTILEGESLLNDATALVCLHSAIAAITGSVTAGQVTVDFARSAVGGTGVGLLVAVVAGRVRARVDDSLTDTAISLVTPFAAYLLAEEIHASGVLAVVIAGLLLGHKAQVLQSASSRMFERTNWRMLEFLLEGSVFLIIGLEARTILEAVEHSELGAGRIALAAVVVLVGVVAIRVAWMLLARVSLVPARAETLSFGAVAVLSWAGMRGVVTLAAAFVLPAQTPHREVLILMAMVVTAGTLLVQGSTLPMLIRRLGLSGPDRAEDALAAATVYENAARAGRERLASLDLTGVAPEVVERLHQRSIDRSNALWERLGGSGETPSEQYARLRRSMLEAEREAVLEVRDAGTVPHEVLAEVLGALDVEESIIEMVDRSSSEDRDEDLVAVAASAPCRHLEEASTDVTPRSDGCEECLLEGTRWVHLRLCLTCGHVGCCDSSPRRHASAHFHRSGHPVIRSHEPGEAWRWCYVDELVG